MFEESKGVCDTVREAGLCVVAQGWIFVMLCAFTGVSNYGTSTVPLSTLFTALMLQFSHTQMCVLALTVTLLMRTQHSSVAVAGE